MEKSACLDCQYHSNIKVLGSDFVACSQWRCVHDTNSPVILISIHFDLTKYHSEKYALITCCSVSSSHSMHNSKTMEIKKATVTELMSRFYSWFKTRNVDKINWAESIFDIVYKDKSDIAQVFTITNSNLQSLFTGAISIEDLLEPIKNDCFIYEDIKQLLIELLVFYKTYVID